MSTPSISAPNRIPGDRDRRGARMSSSLHHLARGNEADPVWARSLLWLVALLSGTLVFWGLTRSGYANTYYAEAAQAASHSWKAWFTNAIDTSGSDSLDKGPLPNMLMGLSGRLLGFSSFSMLVPEALCGVGAVLVLHATVKRTLGHRAAILAALMLALTPIFVAMSRFNNPDALLVLLEVSAAWALVRALQSGRTRHLLLCGVFVGLAFNVKMLQAYLIVPGLALTLLIAGQGSLRRRVAQLLAGGASMVVVSFAWYGTMMLLPAAERPWVGDTTDNSWFSLIFGANGLSRVSGEGGAAVGPGGGSGFGGPAGPLRLFDSIVGGQIAWLLPLAALGLVLGLWASRKAVRTDLRRSAYLLWGGWAAVSWAVFSLSKGIFHPYYTTALAPALAVLAAGCLVALWDRSRSSTAWAAVLAAALIGTAVLSDVLLGRAAGFAPHLAAVVTALAAIAAGGLLLPRLAAARALGFGRGRVAWLVAATGMAAVLAGPAAYSVATVGKSLSGGNPLAGPASAASGFGGVPFGKGAQQRPGGFLAEAPPAGGRPGLPGEGVPGARPSGEATGGVGLAPGSLHGASAGAPAGAGGAGFAPSSLGGGTVSKTLVSYLEAHQGSATYLVAAVGSSTSGSIALQSDRNVIDMGGFMGSDPAPSLAKLKGLISSGELHYVLLSSGQQGGAPGSGQQGSSSDSGQQRSGLGSRPGGGPSASSSATQARNSWIRSHGTVVDVGGTSSSGGMTLYYFSG